MKIESENKNQTSSYLFFNHLCYFLDFDEINGEARSLRY